MNGLKEVSRLIEESENSRNKQAISQDAVMEWMSNNKVTICKLCIPMYRVIKRSC